jgi:hypothetical protein
MATGIAASRRIAASDWKTFLFMAGSIERTTAMATARAALLYGFAALAALVTKGTCPAANYAEKCRGGTYT